MSRLTGEVVELCHANSGRDIEILEDEKMIAAKQNNKNTFLAWAASVVPAQRCKWIEENILKIEQFAVSSGLISGSIFSYTNMITLENVNRVAMKNRIFQIKNKKLIKNIDGDFKTYIQYCAQLPEQSEQIYEVETPVVEIPVDSVRVGVGATACEARFYTYLQNTAKLADRTCISYVSSIRSVERYARNNGYMSCSLFSEETDVIIATVAELYNDPNFVRYNKQQHNRFSAAINRLLESIGMEIPEKAVAFFSDNNEGQGTTSVKRNSEIVTVLNQHYKYGFKIDSIRELMRFRQFADAMGIMLPEEDEALKASILSSGTIIDGRVYCKSDNMIQELQRIIDDVFSSGTNVIFYEILFENEQEWMESHVITSPEMLKEYLQNNIAGCSFSQQFMVKGSRRSEKEAVTDELKRAWGAYPLESVYNLCERLPYVPPRNIWRVISGNDFFVWASEGEYLFIDRFNITEDEEKDILDFANEACEKKGLLLFAMFHWVT